MTVLLVSLITLPLMGAVLLLLGGNATNAWGHLLGCATVISAFACSVFLLLSLLAQPVEHRMVHQVLFSWVQVETLQVEFGLQLDPLSVCFVLLITGVGALIHIYSIGYMRTDLHRRRFFGYLNLFVAAMVLLVLADNYLGLYIGWEGVGLASYLLIGFWSQKPRAASAATKAFVMNRVGDTGLMIALMVLFTSVGSFSFSSVFAAVPELSHSTVTALGLLLLLGACGKSAQIPLQSWLGDAMEGPTPVSALIHAATMVTAGVYLIVRSGPIFDASTTARYAVMIVGAATLLFGAIIGCAKDDIKKALAASTMSQIGYMVLAAGMGPAGYAVAIMHLLAHGFFKAGLFLGAGSVMHAMNDDTDMRRYGGLARMLPITYLTFGLGYVAIIGLPPFSGFFSKDAIIETAFSTGGFTGWLLGCVALLGAGLTAFYMTRVMILTFWGHSRWAPDTYPHEASAIMTVPMIILAIGSAAAGAVLAGGHTLQRWLEPVVGSYESSHGVPHWALTITTLTVVGLGAGIAYRQYAIGEISAAAPQRVSKVTVAARNDLYGDTVNEVLFMRSGRLLTKTLNNVDNNVIDGGVNALARAVSRASDMARVIQTGYVRSYALSIVIGALFVGAMVVIAAVWG